MTAARETDVFDLIALADLAATVQVKQPAEVISKVIRHVERVGAHTRILADSSATPATRRVAEMLAAYVAGGTAAYVINIPAISDLCNELGERYETRDGRTWEVDAAEFRAYYGTDGTTARGDKYRHIPLDDFVRQTGALGPVRRS